MNKFKWIHRPNIIYHDNEQAAVGIAIAHAYVGNQTGNQSLCGRTKLGFFRQPYIGDDRGNRKCFFCERKAK